MHNPWQIQRQKPSRNCRLDDLGRKWEEKTWRTLQSWNCRKRPRGKRAFNSYSWRRKKSAENRSRYVMRKHSDRRRCRHPSRWRDEGRKDNSARECGRLGWLNDERRNYRDSWEREQLPSRPLSRKQQGYARRRNNRLRKCWKRSGILNE